MRTAKKSRISDGGWVTTVTLDDGTELRVELVRGAFRRNWFGNASYYWHGLIFGPGWECKVTAFAGDSAQYLARRGMARHANEGDS